MDMDEQFDKYDYARLMRFYAGHYLVQQFKLDQVPTIFRRVLAAASVRDKSEGSKGKLETFLRSRSSLTSIIPQEIKYLEYRSVKASIDFRKNFIESLELFSEFNRLISEYRAIWKIHPDTLRSKLNHITPIDEQVELLDYCDNPEIYIRNALDYIQIIVGLSKKTEKPFDEKEELSKLKEKVGRLSGRCRLFQEFIETELPNSAMPVPPLVLKKFDIPSRAYPWLRDYLYFGIKRGSISRLHRMERPAVKSLIDKKGQKYIEIRIGEYTDIEWLEKPEFLSYLREIQRTISEGSSWYRKITSDRSRKSLLRQQLFYELMAQDGDCDRANIILEENGYKPIPRNEALAVLRRFEQRFLRNEPDGVGDN